MTEKKKDAPVVDKPAEPAVVDPDAKLEDAPALTPTGEEIVPVDEHDYFRAMSLQDERHIMEEIQGRALDEMLYSFPLDGKNVVGFSWTGVRESVRTLNSRGFTQIRISPEVPPEILSITDETGAESWQCKVYAEDAKTGGGAWGLATQPKEMKLKNGKTKPDTFARTKALSKAQRNAMEALIPLELVEVLKAQYMKKGAVKVIPGAVAQEVERPAALTDERAKGQIVKLREIYDEIKTVNPLAMVPGQFNSIVMGAQHDHDRLDDAIAHLEAFRNTEQKIAKLLDTAKGKLDKKDADQLAVKLDEQPSQKSRETLLRGVLGDEA